MFPSHDSSEQTLVEESTKLSAKEKLAKLKGEKKSVTLGKTPTADKRIDSESLLDYYIKNNIVQKIVNELYLHIQRKTI